MRFLPLFLPLVFAFAQQAPNDPDRWEEAIRSFEEDAEADPPESGGVVFIGSSTIRRWDLDKYFSDRNVINRGFGGSTIKDAIRYADRILIPLDPATVVFYSGGNDIARGETPLRVALDFERFAKMIHEELPETKILYLPIKPSLARWHLWIQIQGANLGVREFAQLRPWVEYVEIEDAMLGQNGRPREELFVEDGLHLSEEGYDLWTEKLQPHLD